MATHNPSEIVADSAGTPYSGLAFLSRLSKNHPEKKQNTM